MAIRTEHVSLHTRCTCKANQEHTHSAPSAPHAADTASMRAVVRMVLQAPHTPLSPPAVLYTLAHHHANIPNARNFASTAQAGSISRGILPSAGRARRRARVLEKRGAGYMRACASAAVASWVLLARFCDPRFMPGGARGARWRWRICRGRLGSFAFVGSLDDGVEWEGEGLA